MKTNKDLIIEPNAAIEGRHGPVSTVTGGEAKRKAVT